MVDLAAATLVHLAPRSGTSGVGDHADDFAAAAAPYVASVREVRHGPPRGDGVAEVRAFRREVRDAVAGTAGPVIVHAELSGGAVASFWALAGLRGSGAVLSATLHDPPRPVWYPYLTRGVARSRWTAHGVHLPLDPLTARLERRVLRGVHVFALSREGVESMTTEHIGATRTLSHLIVPRRPEIPPATDRPRALGLYGHVYTGKGFEHLASLRAQVPADIAIRVAGRGTEALPPLEGVEVLGAVEGADEDAFFASVRALLLPYDKRHAYGHPAFPASSVLARAVAYATPSLSPPEGSLVSAADAGATVLVPGGIGEMGTRAATLIDDRDALVAATERVRAHAATQHGPSALAPFVRIWGAA